MSETEYEKDVMAALGSLESDDDDTDDNTDDTGDTDQEGTLSTEAEEEEKDSDDSSEESEEEDEEEGENKAEAEEDATKPDTKVEEEEEDLKRAPQAWKPKAREAWASLPVEIRREVVRREQDAVRVLQQSTDSRRFQDEFYQSVRPFERNLQAEGVTPMQAFTSLMGIAAGLQGGTQQEKAELVASIIYGYNVDIKELDSTLRAGGGKPDPKVQSAVQNAVAPYERALQQQRAQQAQEQDRNNTVLRQELGQFISDPANEFFQDVKELMTGLLDGAAAKGQTMTLKDAYTKACRMDPEVSDIISLRSKQALQKASLADINKKKKASKSLPPNSSTGKRRQVPTSELGDVEADVAMVMEQLSK